MERLIQLVPYDKLLDPIPNKEELIFKYTHNQFNINDLYNFLKKKYETIKETPTWEIVMEYEYGVYEIDDLQFCFYNKFDLFLKKNDIQKQQIIQYKITSKYCPSSLSPFSILSDVQSRFLFKKIELLDGSNIEYIGSNIEYITKKSHKNDKNKQLINSYILRKFIFNNKSLKKFLESFDEQKIELQINNYELSNNFSDLSSIVTKKTTVYNKDISIRRNQPKIEKYEMDVFIFDTLTISIKDSDVEYIKPVSNRYQNPINSIGTDIYLPSTVSTVSTYINPSRDLKLYQSYSYFTHDIGDTKYYVPYKKITNAPFWKYPIIQNCKYKILKSQNKFQKCDDSDDSYFS